MRGVELEGTKFLYDWCEERKQLVVHLCSEAKYVGKELWKALSKKVTDPRSEVRVLAKKEVDKAAHALQNT